MSKHEADAPHLLIVEARFYDDLADALLDGAKAALDEAGATYDVVTVPGALEIRKQRFPSPSTARIMAARNMTALSRLALSFAARPIISTSCPMNPAARLPIFRSRRALRIGNGILTVRMKSMAWCAAAKTRTRVACGPCRIDHDRPAQKFGARSL